MFRHLEALFEAQDSTFQPKIMASVVTSKEMMILLLSKNMKNDRKQKTLLICGTQNKGRKNYK